MTEERLFTKDILDMHELDQVLHPERYKKEEQKHELRRVEMDRRRYWR